MGLLGQGGLHLLHLGLAGLDGGHDVLHGVGDLALILGDEPLADGAVVLVHFALLGLDGHGELGGLLHVSRLIGGGFGHVLGLAGGDVGILLGFFGNVIKE